MKIMEQNVYTASEPSTISSPEWTFYSLLSFQIQEIQGGLFAKIARTRTGKLSWCISRY